MLAGTDEPADWREALAFAQMALAETKDPAGSLRLYRRAFEASPEAAGDVLRMSHRYNAACAAALTGTKEHAQALAWLRADLDLLSKRPAADAASVVGVLEHWRKDPDLAAVRDAGDLSEDAKRLWKEVDALLERTRKAAPK